VDYKRKSAVPKCYKSSKQGVRPDWLNRDLLVELWWKRKVCILWKQAQATQEDYKDAVLNCRERIHAGKT